MEKKLKHIWGWVSLKTNREKDDGELLPHSLLTTFLVLIMFFSLLMPSPLLFINNAQASGGGVLGLINYNALPQNCYNERYGLVYATQHNFLTAIDIVNGSGEQVGQRRNVNTYMLWRDYELFDTSSIGAGSTITSAIFYFFLDSDSSNTDFKLTIQNGQPLSPHNPPNINDYYYLNYSGDGGFLSTASMTERYWNSITLNATGISWINKVGITKLCLRSSRDISSTAPASNEYILLSDAEGGNTPYMAITYSLDTSTSVDAIVPYSQSCSPLDITASGLAGLDNVSLFYRYSSNNLSGSWNRSREQYTTGFSMNHNYSSALLTWTEYQTFKIGCVGENSTFMLRNVSWYLRRGTISLGGKSSIQCKIVSCNATGYPRGNLLGTSNTRQWDSLPTTYYAFMNFTFPTPLLLNRTMTYGIYLTFALGVGSKVNVGYDNVSSTYAGGYRYNFTAGPVYYRFTGDDYLFKIYGDWQLWNHSGNPDTVSPWLWSFDFPKGDGYYQFFSRGSSMGVYEGLSTVKDAMCWFVLSCVPSYVPLVVGRSLLPFYVLGVGGVCVVGFLFVVGRRRRKKQKG